MGPPRRLNLGCRWWTMAAGKREEDVSSSSSQIDKIGRRAERSSAPEEQQAGRRLGPRRSIIRRLPGRSLAIHKAEERRKVRERQMLSCSLTSAARFRAGGRGKSTAVVHLFSRSGPPIKHQQPADRPPRRSPRAAIRSAASCSFQATEGPRLVRREWPAKQLVRASGGSRRPCPAPAHVNYGPARPPRLAIISSGPSCARSDGQPAGARVGNRRMRSAEPRRPNNQAPLWRPNWQGPERATRPLHFIADLRSRRFPKSPSSGAELSQPSSSERCETIKTIACQLSELTAEEGVREKKFADGVENEKGLEGSRKG